MRPCARNLVTNFTFLSILLIIPAVSGAHEEYGSLTTVGDISGPRFNHTATLFDDGKVLITGGTDDGYRSLKTTEIFLPSTGEWSEGPDMMENRQRHSAEGLPDGRLIIIGGYEGGGHPSLLADYSGQGNRSFSTTEIFDPDTSTFSIGPSLISGRFWQRSIQLRSGDILVIGGLSVEGGALGKCEILDVDEMVWKSASPLNLPRARCTASLLKDGRVLVTGGHDGRTKTPFASCEIYDPARDIWEITTPMNFGRGYHGGALLKDGRYLVSGGFSAPGQPDRSDSEVYDPETKTWTMQSDLYFPRHNHESVLLDSGMVIIMGGSNCQTGGCHSTLEFFDPVTGEWEDSFIIVMGRKWVSAVTMTDGSVMITGGMSCGEPTSRTELYTPPSIGGKTHDDVFGLPEIAIILILAMIPLIVLAGVAHSRK